MEGLGYQPIYLALTGSHVWGLATPESDTDIRGIYAWPIERALSLYPGKDNWEGSEGNVDWQCYELAKALRMLCKNNGNLVEMLLNPYRLHADKVGRRLTLLASECLTKELSPYYLGYATSQRKRAMRNRGGKALIYTYREIFAGIWLMREGEIVFDFHELRNLIDKQVGFASAVLAWALENRDTPTPDDVMALFEAEWNVLEGIFKDTRDTSDLPERKPDDFRERCEELLIAQRTGVMA
jgi:predicted nucleotidyltransferase